MRRWMRWMWVFVTLGALAWGGMLGYKWLRKPLRALRGGPAGIVIHHTATGPRLNGRLVDVATIDAMHARRGFAAPDRDGTVYHIGYHYLIQQDGTVLPGRPEHLRGAHTKGHSDMLGIALVGNFHPSSNRGRQGPSTPPPAQLQAAERLTATLMRKYDLTPKDVYLHRDLGSTACPGANFPRKSFYDGLTRDMQQEGK